MKMKASRHRGGRKSRSHENLRSVLKPLMCFKNSSSRALTHKADLEEAHVALAKRYRQKHEEAEQSSDLEAAQQAEMRLREHAGALPEGHAERTNHFAYLKGVGALTITSEAADRIVVERYVQHYRRLALEPVASFSTSQLVGHALEMGSYLIRVQKKGCHDSLYPIFIGRGSIGAAETRKAKFNRAQPTKGILSDNEVFHPRRLLLGRWR